MTEAAPRGWGRSSEVTQAWVRALTAIAGIEGSADTLPDRLPALAASFGDRPALICDNETLSYRDLAARANQYGHWAAAQGVRPGDVVCLMMPNRADYGAAWLGISGVGGVVALLNTGLRQDALRHAIAIVSARVVLADEALLPAMDDVRARLDPAIGWFVRGPDAPGWTEAAIEAWPDHPVARERPPAPADRALHIYTSGTTGLPKAVNITHRRVLEWSLWFAAMMDIGPEDRMYNCLPMYHSIGGVVAVGSLLVRGGSVLIRPGFSVSRFWDEIGASGCTLFQYIGELCRYLVNAPPHPAERSHRLRLACGNGMQQAVWTRFVERFAVPRVLEYYAATEGGVSLTNVEGRPGSIGRVPPFLAHRFPVALIRVDGDTGAPLRDAKGRCMRCGVDEAGEAIGPAGARDIYTDARASEAKILRDAFAPGDAWFRTGDLMRRDRAGFLTFVDRLGDTFRWKGENVATTEVADALGQCPGVAELVVYGVRVPGAEGRAGMAALAVDARFTLEGLYAHAATRLPEQARPVFLRIRPSLEATATFKPIKATLAAEGFDPARISDALYMSDRTRQSYLPLDAALFARIVSGAVRL